MTSFTVSLSSFTKSSADAFSKPSPHVEAIVLSASTTTLSFPTAIPFLRARRRTASTSLPRSVPASSISSSLLTELHPPANWSAM
jgi:hypothetical protein